MPWVNLRVFLSVKFFDAQIPTGNKLLSPQMVFAHYRQLVSETQANEWFGIVPPKDWTKIQPMPAESTMSQQPAPEVAAAVAG